MNISTYENMVSKINQLKKILSRIETEELVEFVASEFGIVGDKSDNIFTKTQLSSPFKQYLYLIGLLLSTELKTTSELTPETIGKIKSLLEQIGDSYAEVFFPDEEQVVDENWLKVTEVSMPVFLNYFNTNSLTYEEQVMDRITEWYSPFNDYIQDQWKLNVEELLNIFDFIRKKLQKNIDDIKILSNRVAEDQKLFLKYMKLNNLSIEQTSQELHLPNTLKLAEKITLIHQIKVKELQQEFGEEAINNFIDLFTLIRKNGDFFYYTEKNPFETSPIWLISEERLFVPIYKQIIHAIQLQLTSLLESSEFKTKFYKNRDDKTEKKTFEIFYKFLGDSANYYTSVYENNKSQKEHDLLIQYGEFVFIVEIKAAKVKEPFRDPNKAYTRIKRDFKSDGGIQKGYDQALNLKKLILKNEESILYDDKGKEIVRLNRRDIKKVFCIVVTAEDMGILSTNLSYLLEKPETEPYPWACNLYDLETALDGIKYKKGTVNTFITYLQEREEYHEHLIASDELEILGYFLERESLKSLNFKKDNKIILDPSFSMVFDEIYYEKRGIFKKTKIYKNVVKSENKNKKKNKRKESKGSRKKNRKK